MSGELGWGSGDGAWMGARRQLRLFAKERALIFIRWHSAALFDAVLFQDFVR